jgi:hypothetical protein
VAYLHCPSCHRTAWLGPAAEPRMACRDCGTTLGAVLSGEAPFLSVAVRELHARDAVYATQGRRFVREA